LKTALGKLVDNKKMIQRSNGNSSINECDSPACRKVALQVEELQSLLDIKADKIDSVISLITECYCAFDSLHSAESYVGGKMELIRINLEGVMAFVERAFMRQENSQMGSVGKIVERARISAKRTFAWQKPLSETSLSALRKAMAQLASKANIIQLPNGNSSINGCDNLVCRKVASRIEELQLLLYAKANKIDGAVAPIIECLYKRIPESQIDAQAKEIEKMLEKVRIFVQQNPMPEDDMLILKTTLDRLANNKDMIHFEDNYNCSISDYKYNCFSCYDVLSQIEDLQVLLSAKISGIGDIVTPIIERLYQPISQKEIDAQMRKIGIMLEDIKTAVQQNSISKKGMSALETALNKLAYKNGVIQWNYSIDSHINIPSCRQVIWQIKELKSMLELPYTKAVATTRQNVEYDQQRIAAEMASECFGASGKIDLGKARELRDRIKSFTVLPKKFSTIPGASLMLSQVSCVLDNLIDHAQETGNLREIIDRANELSPGNHGRQILNIMGDDLKSPVKPGEAILISLFSLHRQKGLSSCATSSIINAELRNHPERIAKILEQILAGSTFNLPSGHPIHQQQIVGGNGRYYIPANLATGDNAQRDEIFAQENLYDYLAAGIERDSSNPYGLLLPVRNLTDVLFANFFQASEFGNKYLSIKDDLEHGTAFIYYGARDNNSVYSKQGISVAGTDFKAGMERLKRAAEEQKARGMHYMRVATENMAWDMWNHTENIDIDALLKLDLDALKIGKPHIIGDRNWIDEKGRPVFLAIVKIITPASNRPIYSFQSVSSGEPTEKEDVLRFDVYQPL
jgi:hypothetical protein